MQRRAELQEQQQQQQQLQQKQQKGDRKNGKETDGKQQHTLEHQQQEEGEQQQEAAADLSPRSVAACTPRSTGAAQEETPPAAAGESGAEVTAAADEDSATAAALAERMQAAIKENWPSGGGPFSICVTTPLGKGPPRITALQPVQLLSPQLLNQGCHTLAVRDKSPIATAAAAAIAAAAPHPWHLGDTQLAAVSAFCPRQIGIYNAATGVIVAAFAAAAADTRGAAPNQKGAGSTGERKLLSPLLHHEWGCGSANKLC